MKSEQFAIHYDNQAEPREVVIKSPNPIDKYWTMTNKGALFTATLFPVEMKDRLLEHWIKLKAAQEKVKTIQGEIYFLMNDSSAWRNNRE